MNTTKKLQFQIKPAISLLIIFLTLALLVYYLSNHISDFKELGKVALSNIWLVIMLFILGIFFIFLNGFLLGALMRPFGIKLGLKESFGLASITNFYNMITPFRGGMAARAVYLKTKYKFPYVNFLATLSAIYIIIFLVGSFAGLLSMAFIYFYYKIFNLLVFSLFLGIFLCLLLIIIISPKIPLTKNNFLNRFIKVINGWHLIKNNKEIILTTFFISLTQLILGSIGIIINYSIFGIHLGFFQALFLNSIGSIAILVAITPGNLGIGDAISVFSASLIGVGLSTAVASAILGRAINLILALILGPIFSYILLKHDQQKTERENIG